MIFKKIVYILLLSVSILILSPLITFAESVGKISLIEGNVDILLKGKTEAEIARINMPVGAGDIIRTKSNSKAEIRFADDSIIRLAEKSRIEIKEYMFEKDIGKRKGTINLFRGKMRSLIGKAVEQQHDYNVITKTAVAGVRGTDFFVISQPLSTQVIVKEGIVAVKNISPKVIGEVLVKVNQMTNVVQNTPPPPPVTVPVEVMKGLTAETEPAKVEKKKMEDKERPPEKGEPSRQPDKKEPEKAPEKKEPSQQPGQKGAEGEKPKAAEGDKGRPQPSEVTTGPGMPAPAEGMKPGMPPSGAIEGGMPSQGAIAPEMPPAVEGRKPVMLQEMAGAGAPPGGVMKTEAPPTGVMSSPIPPGVTMPGMPPPGMAMPPGMTMPGMMPPGMILPPGMTIPPGMIPPAMTITPGMTMPPGMIPPGMTVPPGMAMPGTTAPGMTMPGTMIPGMTVPGMPVPGAAIPGITGTIAPPTYIPPITEVNPALLRPKVKIKVEF